MKKIFTIVLIIIFGFLCIWLGYTESQADDNSFKEGYFIKQGYSFKIPEGWSYDISLKTEAIIKEGAQDESGFSPYMVFLNDKLNGRTPEQFFNYVKSEIKNNVLEFEVIEEKDDGDFHILEIQAEKEGRNIAFKIAFIEGYDDNYWFITLNDTAENIGEDDKAFNEVYQSFELR